MSVRLVRSGASAIALILATPALCQTALPTITVGAAHRVAAPRHVVATPVEPVVHEEKPKPVVATPSTPLSNFTPATSDAAQLLQKTPGVSMYENGGVSRLPVIHGMADDRLKVLVGGVKTTSACANHMNPPLSYVDPNNIEKIDVHSGVMSVSDGGDSIGGTIVVTPRSPVFAAARPLAPSALPTHIHGAGGPSVPAAVSPGGVTAAGPAPASWPVVPNWPLHGKGERFGPDGEVFVSGLISSFFRTVNNGVGVSGTFNVATDHYSLLYNGAWQRATNYHAGDDGPKVLSTGFISENHAATLAYQNDGHLLSLRGSIQNIPYQGFVNQRMDMTKNRAYQVDAKYLGAFDWGIVDFNAFYQYTYHQMNMLYDKQIDNMPMETNGKDFGYRLKIEHKVDDNNLVRLGSEFHGFRLNDYWQPIPDYCAQLQCLSGVGQSYQGYGGGYMWAQDYTTYTNPSGADPRITPMGMLMMGPNTQWNIRDGKRDRVAHYAEWLAKWSPEWSTELGLRNEIVMMNSGNAQPYDWRDPAPMPMYVGSGSGFFWDPTGRWTLMEMANPDAPAAIRYNQRNRSRVDVNFDLTARAKYEPDPFSSYEFGYSRKTRSPNLYERYAWVVGSMSTAMINWFGDGNGYTGNLDLKPEVAHTFGITGSWRDPAGNWEARVAPYFSYIENYINADRYQDFRFTGTGRPGPYTFGMLYFRNHRAIIYGFDISGRLKLLDSPDYGLFTGTALINYTYGRDLDIGNVQNCNGFRSDPTLRPATSTLLADQACYANAGNVDKGDALYNIMPLNARLGVEHRLGGWSSGIDLQLVDSKTHVSIQRNEQKTPAYALLNLRTSYEWENMRIDLGIENLTDQRYYPALGGFYFTGYKHFTNTGQAPLGIAGPVPGPGRNFIAGLTVKF